MKTKNVRTLKNGVTAGYVLQKDGTWKWRFLTGPTKTKKQSGGWGMIPLSSLGGSNKKKKNKQSGGWGQAIPLPSSVQSGGWGRFNLKLE